MPHILIFKTNIESDNAHLQVGSILNAHASVIDWHIDKEDVDKILRIESTINNTKEIISKIKQAGFICEELPD
jgi:DNA replicative helicase MCM subunit Mcm2 (Cdc46/Mcm family)